MNTAAAAAGSGGNSNMMYSQYNNHNNLVTSSSANNNGRYYGNNTSNATTSTSSAMGSRGMQMMSGSMNTNNNNSMMMGNHPSMMMSGAIGGSGSAAVSLASTSSSSSSAVAAPHIFDPNAAKQQQQQNNNNTMTSIDEEDYDNEPPLLEELGVNFPHIYSKSRAVLFPIGKHAKSLEAGLIEDDADLAGPLAFALGLGGELLLAGKMHFGYVYGFGLSGCLAMTLLLNLLNPNGAVSMWTVVSILGYALLPVNLLAGINVLYRVHRMNVVGVALAVVIILWCTAASTRLFERGCQMRDQRFLVAYPAALLYSAFVMITIF